MLNGALPYGLFQNIKENVPFFKTNGYTLYDKLIGFNYYLTLKEKTEEIMQVFGEEKGRQLL